MSGWPLVPRPDGLTQQDATVLVDALLRRCGVEEKLPYSEVARRLCPALGWGSVAWVRWKNGILVAGDEPAFEALVMLVLDGGG